MEEFNNEGKKTTEGAKNLENKLRTPSASANFESSDSKSERPVETYESSQDSSWTPDSHDPVQNPVPPSAPVPPPFSYGTTPSAPVPPVKKSRNILAWILSGVIVVLVVIICVLYSEYDDKSTQAGEIYYMLLADEEMIEDAAEKMPVVIHEIRMGIVDKDNNIITGYGLPMYSSNTQYLSPQISVLPLTSGSFELSVLFYDRYGNPDVNNGDNPRQSYTSTIYVEQGEAVTLNLIGWGGAESGWWDSGKYRVEIWYGDVCLGGQDFRVL